MSCNLPALPQAPGTYLLMFHRTGDGFVEVGRLGRLHLHPGWYAYVGSAFGGGGLRGRLSHHLRPLRSCHWHVDYLRRHAALREVWVRPAAERLEHRWAAALGSLGPGGSPVPRFGCSDCGCVSHLIHFRQYPGAQSIATGLQARLALEIDAAGATGKPVSHCRA